MPERTVTLRVEVIILTATPEAESRVQEYGPLAVAQTIVITRRNDLSGTDGYADLPLGALTGYIGDIDEEY